MKGDLIYALKIWLTAVVTAPLLLLGWDSYGHGWAYEDINYAVAATIIGLVMSVPYFGLLLLTVRQTLRLWDINLTRMKAFWSAISAVISALPFVIMGGGKTVFAWEILPVVLIYYSVIVFGIWFYKLKLQPDNSDDNEIHALPNSESEI